MKINDNLKALLLFSALMLLLGVGYFSSRWSNSAIDNCSKKSIGKIERFIKLHAKMPRVEYSYEIDGQKYFNREGLPKFIAYDQGAIGKSIRIEFECENPSNSRIISTQ